LRGAEVVGWSTSAGFTRPTSAGWSPRSFFSLRCVKRSWERSW